MVSCLIRVYTLPRLAISKLRAGRVAGPLTNAQVRSLELEHRANKITIALLDRVCEEQQSSNQELQEHIAAAHLKAVVTSPSSGPSLVNKPEPLKAPLPAATHKTKKRKARKRPQQSSSSSDTNKVHDPEAAAPVDAAATVDQANKLVAAVALPSLVPATPSQASEVSATPAQLSEVSATSSQLSTSPASSKSGSTSPPASSGQLDSDQPHTTASVFLRQALGIVPIDSALGTNSNASTEQATHASNAPVPSNSSDCIQSSAIVAHTVADSSVAHAVTHTRTDDAAAAPVIKSLANGEELVLFSRQPAVLTDMLNTPTLADELASAPAEARDNYLGAGLLYLVQQQQPHLAGKIAGMIFLLDNAEVLGQLANHAALCSTVQAAVDVLWEAHMNASVVVLSPRLQQASPQHPLSEAEAWELIQPCGTASTCLVESAQSEPSHAAPIVNTEEAPQMPLPQELVPASDPVNKPVGGLADAVLEPEAAGTHDSPDQERTADPVAADADTVDGTLGHSISQASTELVTHDSSIFVSSSSSSDSTWSSASSAHSEAGNPVMDGSSNTCKDDATAVPAVESCGSGDQVGCVSTRPAVLTDICELPNLAANLAASTADFRYNYLGAGVLYLVQQRQPHLACKITGMILQLDDEEVLWLLTDHAALCSKVQDAIHVLWTAHMNASAVLLSPSLQHAPPQHTLSEAEALELIQLPSSAPLSTVESAQAEQPLSASAPSSEGASATTTDVDAVQSAASVNHVGQAEVNKADAVNVSMAADTNRSASPPATPLVKSATDSGISEDGHGIQYNAVSSSVDYISPAAVTPLVAFESDSALSVADDSSHAAATDCTVQPDTHMHSAASVRYDEGVQTAQDNSNAASISVVEAQGSSEVDRADANANTSKADSTREPSAKSQAAGVQDITTEQTAQDSSTAPVTAAAELHAITDATSDSVSTSADSTAQLKSQTDPAVQCSDAPAALDAAAEAQDGTPLEAAVQATAELATLEEQVSCAPQDLSIKPMDPVPSPSTAQMERPMKSYKKNMASKLLVRF